ncbi:MAG TPA: hypothetical protein VGF22_10630 [Acidimicrobiales bacterium]
MLLWFWGTAFLTVWAVFHDPSIDYRVLFLGAVLPDLIDAPFGGARVAHSVTFCVAALVVVMLATIGRRTLRRRLLFLPIGMLLHLVFDGTFTDARVFWWPFSGLAPPDAPLPSVDRGAWNLLLELIGFGILAWAWRRFHFSDPAHRRVFWRTGHLVVGSVID